MAITIEALERQVCALKAYRQAQLATFYDDYKPVDTVDECTSMDRLRVISKVTGESIRQGYKHAEGYADTMVVYWRGCRFWAPSGRAE